MAARTLSNSSRCSGVSMSKNDLVADGVDTDLSSMHRLYHSVQRVGETNTTKLYDFTVLLSFRTMRL